MSKRRSKAPGKKSSKSRAGQSSRPPTSVSTPSTPPAAQALPATREDEVSVPPVTPELDDAFFASEPPPAHARIPAELDPTRDVRLEMLASPAAHARRAQLAKYVKAVVGVSLAVCFLAFIRLAIQRNHAPTEAAAMAATEPPRAVPAAAPAPEPKPGPKPEPKPAPQPTPAVAPVATQAQDTRPESAAPATAETADKVAEKPAEAAPPAAPSSDVQPDPAAAKKEKRASQLALERGAAADAIAHGELAVKLDPTDGEAWLILGAAYQAKGSWAEARRCYKSCLTDGKAGPRGECAAMLR